MVTAPPPVGVPSDAPRSSVLPAALLSTGGMVVQGAGRLAYTVLIGRAFGTESLGHASTLLSFSVFVALLWPTPAGTAASRFLALGGATGTGAAGVRRALDLSMALSSAVLVVLTVPVALALGNTLGVALSAGWLVAAYGAYAFARGARLGLLGSRRVAVWDSVSAFVALGALVAVCASGTEGLVLVPLAAGYTMFAVACWPRRRGAEGGEGRGRAAIAFAAWNVVTGVATNGLLQLAMIVAQVAAPGREAGIYAAAFTLATPASMLGQAVSQVVIPAFAHRTTEAPFRERGPVLLTLTFSACVAVVFGLVALAAPWYLPLFYPAEAEGAVDLLRFLMLGVYVFTIGLIPAALLLAAGRSRDVALASVAGFVVGVIVMVLAGPSWGVQAGSLGFLVGSSINLVTVAVLAAMPSRQTKRRTARQ